jgi:hypothetical protein
MAYQDRIMKYLYMCSIRAMLVGGFFTLTATNSISADGPEKPKAVKPADDLSGKIKALLAKYREMRAKDTDKAGAQAIKDSGKLARENPDELRPWSLYLSAANHFVTLQ